MHCARAQWVVPCSRAAARQAKPACTLVPAAASPVRCTTCQVGVCDPVHVFVHWTCHGTNLQPTLDNAGRPHKPTFHESHIRQVMYVDVLIAGSRGSSRRMRAASQRVRHSACGGPRVAARSLHAPVTHSRLSHCSGRVGCC